MGQLEKVTGYGYLFQPVDILVDAFEEVYVLKQEQSDTQTVQ